VPYYGADIDSIPAASTRYVATPRPIHNILVSIGYSGSSSRTRGMKFRTVRVTERY